MSTAAAAPFSETASSVQRLHAAVTALQLRCAGLGLAPLEGREWYELLTRKLLPQLVDEPFLVAAVVGGTNIGKSVVFNHLAGTRASASSPLASGTRHPVCLVPPGFENRHNLSRIFPGFTLEEWSTADAALGNFEDDRLFWRTCDSLPANLLVLDTPDIDSDAPVNWRRADRIRHCADVLVAVLTQQKYNDAAVKQFFRHAAAEDKASLIVFNQCHLPEDEAYWPKWLATFSSETGLKPNRVYIAPHDRRAAEENRLPFYERDWPQGESAASGADGATPRSLRTDLTSLHFDSIKLQTVRGSLQQLASPEHGPLGYLDQVRRCSEGFRDAVTLLSLHEAAHIERWPVVPNSLVINEIREWWRLQRTGFTRVVHDAYGTVGDFIGTSFSWVRNRLFTPQDTPGVKYLADERDVLLQALDRVYSELDRLSKLGNEMLAPRLQKLLAGASRSQLVEGLIAAHQSTDLHAAVREVVDRHMQQFSDSSPATFRTLKQLDTVAAVARPATSVALFLVGAGPLADSIMPVAANVAVVHVVGNIAAGTGAVLVGETAAAGAVSAGRQMEIWFRNLHSAITQRRVSWFAGFLKANLLGNLHENLLTAANAAESPEFTAVSTAVAEIRRSLIG